MLFCHILVQMNWLDHPICLTQFQIWSEVLQLHNEVTHYCCIFWLILVWVHSVNNLTWNIHNNQLPVHYSILYWHIHVVQPWHINCKQSGAFWWESSWYLPSLLFSLHCFPCHPYPTNSWKGKCYQKHSLSSMILWACGTCGTREFLAQLDSGTIAFLQIGKASITSPCKVHIWSASLFPGLYSYITSCNALGPQMWDISNWLDGPYWALLLPFPGPNATPLQNSSTTGFPQCTTCRNAAHTNQRNVQGAPMTTKPTTSHVCQCTHAGALVIKT